MLHQKEVEGAAEEERANQQLLQKVQQPALKGGQAPQACSCSTSDCTQHTPVCNVEARPTSPAGSPTSSHKKNAVSYFRNNFYHAA